MKRIAMAAIFLVVAVSVYSVANAGMGMGGGCDKCAQQGAAAPSDPFRKFQADTIDLRQEMMNKRFEMQRENLKGAPDKTKIAVLQADITALQAKIMDIRSKSGLPVDKCDGECGRKMGGCDMMKGMVGCGKAMGGCNSGPCSGQK